MTPILTYFAETTTSSNPLAGGWIMPILLIVMFYFLLIRPQQQQRKQQQERINALQPGDKIITTAGIHGIVHHIKDKTVTIKVAESTMIEFDKLAIASVTKKDNVA